MHKYRILGKKGEGTFSEVLKAQCTKNGRYVAIKYMKNHFDSVEQVNRLREIQALRRLSPHPNIIRLFEVLYDRSTGRLALVFELLEMNIYELIRNRKQYVPEERILHYMYQLVKSMDHMHKNGIFHRDIKPENILIFTDTLKLADFGSCRGIYSKHPFTEYISTRWYRAPECLLTDGYYNYKMDMWGVGCVFFEIMTMYPLFPGSNELDQIHKIHNVIGTPPVDLLNKLKKHSSHIDFDFPPKPGTGIQRLVPHAGEDAMDLMIKLLTYNPDERISAKQALRHPYFKEIRQIDRQLRLKAKQQREQKDSGDDSPSTPGRTGTEDDMQPLRDSSQATPTPGSTEANNASNGYLPKLGKGSVTHALEGDKHRDGGSTIGSSTTLPSLGNKPGAGSMRSRDDDSDEEDI